MNKINIGNDLYLKGRIGWRGLAKNEYLKRSDYRIINATSLEDKLINWDICGYITKERYDESPEIQLKEKDILISKDGTLGKIGYVKNLTQPSTVASGVFVLRNIKSSIIDTDYLYQYLKSHYFKLFISRIKADGSTINHLYQRDLSQLTLDVPSLSSQKKIAAILSSIDSKIELNIKMNTELERIAKTIYDYWFVQFDFPDRYGKPYKTNGGKMVWSEQLKKEIPEGWKVGIASDLFDFNPSLSLKANSEASYIDMDALPTDGYMTKSVQKKVFKGGIKFQNGDLLFARITPCLENGKTGLVTLLHNDEIGFGSTEFIVLRGKNRSLSSFAANLSRSELFRKYAITNMTGTSGRKRLDAKVLEKYPIPIPEMNLLDKFEKIVGKFFQQETINTIQNQHLSTLRDWLLPMLMNGQVKVSSNDFHKSKNKLNETQQEILPL